MSQRDLPVTGSNPVREINAASGNETYELPSGFAAGRQLTIRRKDSVSANTVTVTVPLGFSIDGQVNGTRSVPPGADVVFERGDGTTWESYGPRIGNEASEEDVAALAAVVANKADTTTVNTQLAAKADAASVTTALALKADTSTVTTALAAKADTSTVNDALALKADASALTSGLAAKADASTTTTALSNKADTSAVNAALALKADASALAAKADTTTVNSALALKADTTAVALKADTSTVNAALALKADGSALTSGLAAKADASTTTAALALKADASAITAVFLKDRGVWSSATAYVANDVASYANIRWRAVAASTNTTPGSDATKWEVYGVMAAGTRLVRVWDGSTYGPLPDGIYTDNIGPVAPSDVQLTEGGHTWAEVDI